MTAPNGPNEPTGPETNIAARSTCSASAAACFDELTGDAADLVRFRPATRWANTSLTWSVSGFLPNCDEELQSDLVARAFALWSEVCALTFTPSGSDADITISFLAGDHGDMFPFDGAGGTLGHAFFPSSRMGGEVHMNSDRRWSACHDDGLDLFTALVHEIGHALGVEHVRNDTSVMSPGYMQPLAGLTDEDVDAVRRLYGDNEGKIVPAEIVREDGDTPDFAGDLGGDTDGDGIPDSVEVLVFATSPFRSDTDDDGVDDFIEIFVDGSDPLEPPPTELVDSDGDGLSDVDEIVFFGTDPFSADTDGDGLDDFLDPLPTNAFFGDDTVDPCAANGWYGDYECDTFCPLLDPDCSDICLSNGYYGDFECDTGCPLIDPDCEDICAVRGFYGDGECDAFCNFFDPDCALAGVESGDICAENGWYGDLECDTFCPLLDPDCEDPCLIDGFYGDGECDTFCVLPDPDCDDICAIAGFYGDGECDTFCLLYDFDCDDSAFCDPATGQCSGFEVCSDDCPTAFDGECDDGGFDAMFIFCSFGTDCGDCGPRSSGDAPLFACFNDCVSAFDGECDDGGSGADFAICEFGTDCGDCGPRDPGDAPLVLCSNQCDSAFDGECDDGEPGADFAICDVGTDCADCGPRDGNGP